MKTQLSHGRLQFRRKDEKEHSALPGQVCLLFERQTSECVVQLAEPVHASAKASWRGGGWRRSSAESGKASAMRRATEALAKIIISAMTAIMGSSVLRCTCIAEVLHLPTSNFM